MQNRPRKSRVGLLLVPAALLLLVTVTTLGWVVKLLLEHERDAVMIDIAGHQQMLQQHYVADALRAADGDRVDPLVSLQQFETALGALRAGGTLEDPTGSAVRLPGAPTAEIETSLDKQARMVARQSASIRRLLSLPVGSSERRVAAREAVDASAELSAEIEHSISLYAEFGMQRLSAVRRWSVASAALTALLCLALVAQTLRIAWLNRNLQVGEERFDLAVQGSGDGLWDWDIVTDRVYYAPQFIKLLGFDGSEFPPVADSFRKHLHPEDRERVFAAFMDHLRKRTPFNEEFRHQLKDDTVRHFRARGQAVWNESGRATRMAGSIADITDLKLAEAQLRTARDAAETANRAKSRFLANMSHELRTPLNSVIGFSNLLLDDRAEQHGDKDRSHLERIRDNGLHLLQLINEVLDISKIEAGGMDIRLESIELETVVTETLAALEGAALAKGLTLASEVPPSLEPVRADSVRLKQVLINLVGNAIKFTESGQVNLRVLCQGTTRTVQRIEVSDTGIGIPPDMLDSIFDAFQQVDTSRSRAYGGTGLGLTISHSLCRLMGFDLVARSELGDGSTFEVRLRPELHASRSDIGVAADSARAGDVR